MAFISINPTTGEEIARFEPHSADDVDRRLSAGATAQATWRAVPIAKRVDLLRAAAKVLRADADRLARLITREMGKPLAEAKAEIEKCAWNCDFYSESAPRFLADEIVASSASESAIAYNPLGVVLAIMPWNFPFWQFFRFAAPALAAGNAALLKHAANVPGCARALADLARAAGAPDGLVVNLPIEVARVQDVIADDRVAAVTLTGSTQAGAALKKQVLELGGSDPFVVLADADVAAAAAAAVASRFVNTGQSCVNAKRLIVADRVAEEFVAAFTEHTRALKVGDPASRGT